MSGGPTFDIEFEDAVIAQCLRDDGYLRAAVRIADAHHFGTKEHAWVWKTISANWTKFRERPHATLIIAAARAEFKKDDERKPYLALVARLLKTPPTGPKAALEELRKFVRQVNAQLAGEKIAEALEKGDVEAAEKAAAGVAKSGLASDQNWTYVSWIEEFEERQAARKFEKEHPELFKIIPTGLPKLDKALGGGIRKGEVGLIMGTTGRGKSILENNITHAGISRKHPCAAFALEMPARQVAARHDSRWSGYEYSKFKTYDFKPSELRELEARLLKAKKAYAKLLHIFSMPVRSADIRTVRNALEWLKGEKGIEPAFVVLDSADHLKAIDQSLDSFRLQQAEVYWSVKELAEELGIAVWTTVHAGREWAVQLATAEATSESYDKARIADIICSVNDPNAKNIGRRRKAVEIVVDEEAEDEPAEVKGYDAMEEGRRRMELFLAKYRDGVSQLKIPLDCDFARMTIKEAEEGGAAAAS